MTSAPDPGIRNGFLRLAGLWVMAMLYVAAGLNHFIHPLTYMRIMPPYLPAHAALVASSGIAEMGLGVLLLPGATRRAAAWGIIALLIAVFPANIQMAIDWQEAGHPHSWVAWARLPLQAVLVWWAHRYTRGR